MATISDYLRINAKYIAKMSHVINKSNIFSDLMQRKPDSINICLSVDMGKLQNISKCNQEFSYLFKKKA